MYGDPFPAARPAGLRRRRVHPGTTWWRIEQHAPDAWKWDGFAVPRHRFDAATGAFRTRHAAATFAGAARERYFDTGLYLPTDHADHVATELTCTRALLVLDLRTERNLHALDVDDRINTGHEPAVWTACHRLADAVRQWWPDLDGIVYRSRTAPATSQNLAFFSADGLSATSRPLRACRDELDDLILLHHFTVDFDADA
jgi:hypothetical protein